MQVESHVLKMFNCLIKNGPSKPDASLFKIGAFADFQMTNEQRAIVSMVCEPLPIRTLFTVEERNNPNKLFDLLQKQLLHYFEVYGLNTPGLFNLEVESGQVITLNYIKGITVDELAEKVEELLYKNAPLSAEDIVALKSIIKEYNIDYDFGLIENNEIRIALYDPKVHCFSSGDDAVRYMVYIATGQTLVIKNTRQIAQIKQADIPVSFFERNAFVLSHVFNRFKPLILAAKNKNTRTAINKIARMSKREHIRVYESVSKHFMSTMLKFWKLGNGQSRFDLIIDKLDNRDIYKMLNLINYKHGQHAVEAYVIRNGTVHINRDVTKYPPRFLVEVMGMLLNELKKRLNPLNEMKILLDPKVDYGLPISRKQTVGKLPFGTTVTTGGGTISSGIYWKNDWGAYDLDLSTVDLKGHRVGWGSWSAYTDNNIKFSGDITSAPNGAMEFMTSSTADYGLYINIYNGDDTSGVEVVVGDHTDSQWINNVIIREKTNLMGKGSIVGFVKGDKFIVFQGKLNDRIANFGEANPVMVRASTEMWTIKTLFDAIGIKYDTKPVEIEYDYDLTYSEFSLDKLEEIL